ncbi:MAG TPA: CPBP family intramembrane glutamic endopeptidase [Pirellulales bacterium]|nr:CPBP family intramembrane glutamic endopeptidase [Pirellulales bacterium]
MPSPAIQLARDMFSGDNRRASVVLLTSSLCLAAWHLVGNYNFWLAHVTQWMPSGFDPQLIASICFFACSFVLLGLIPLLVVKLILHERVADYGLRWGDLRFGLPAVLLVAPLVAAIGYCSAQSPAFQAVYPLCPIAPKSASGLAWHMVGQLFWYAAWEFHFRGFLQFGLEKSHGISVGIWVQTLASMLAHFGKPGAEVFASIVAGVLWGALAWRTRSLLAGFLQHWLLGASLDFFLCRRV